MEKPQSLTVNLAKNRGETFWDRFISWALTAGRIVVILTEAVALSAFLYRFSLDRKLVDLHDHISQEQAVVNLLKDNEATYRNLQSRLLLAKNTLNSAQQSTKTFNDILQIIPQDMEVTTFQMTQDSIRLEGSMQSITSLRHLVDQLKSYPLVTAVSIDKIQTNTSTSSVSVSVSVQLKSSAVSTPSQSNQQQSAAQTQSL